MHYPFCDTGVRVNSKKPSECPNFKSYLNLGFDITEVGCKTLKNICLTKHY